MGCPQRFYLGEIRNQIAFTPPTQGTYNIALTKTDASGTSTVATSVADVDTPAGWTTAYKFMQTHTTPLYGHTHQDVYSYAGVTGSVSGLTSSSQVSWNTGPGSQTVNVSNLPRHSYVNVFASVYPGSLPVGATVKIYLDGELVVTSVRDAEHSHFTFGGSKILIGSSDHATIRVEVSEIPSTTQWYLASAGIETFLPTVSLSGGGNVDEGGSTTITATRDNPYDASTWASMSPAEQAEALPALTVPLDWSGSAGESDIGNRPSEIKIPAGELLASKSITAADDNAAEWGETAIVAPKNSDQPYFVELNNNAKINIFDNDFKITLDADNLIINNNDSDEDGINDLEDTDGVTNDPDLYELMIKAPTDFVPDASLSISAPSQVKLYTDANKQHLVTTATWILSAFNGSLPTKLFVEAVAGSVTVGDIIISGVLDNPATTQATTRPASTQSSTTQPATGEGIKISWLDPKSFNQVQIPNNNKPIDFWVGEVATAITAEWIGPHEGNISYSWQIADAYAYSWNDVAVPPVLTKPDLTKDKIDLYWYSQGAKTAKVTIQDGNNVTRSAIINFNLASVAPQFDLSKKDVSVDGNFSHLGNHDGNPTNAPFLHLGDGNKDDPNTAGVIFSISNLNQLNGDLKWIQTASVHRSQLHVDGSYYDLSLSGLDSEVSVEIAQGGVVGDSPAKYLDINEFTEFSVDDEFKTYLMFKPKVGISQEWVPLGFVSWKFKGTAKFVNGRWSLVPNSNAPVNPQFQASSEYPTWNHKITPQIDFAFTNIANGQHNENWKKR